MGKNGAKMRQNKAGMGQTWAKMSKWDMNGAKQGKMWQKKGKMGQRGAKRGRDRVNRGFLGQAGAAAVRRSPARCRPPTRPPPRNPPGPDPDPAAPREWGRAPLPPVMLRPGGVPRVGEPEGSCGVSGCPLCWGRAGGWPGRPLPISGEGGRPDGIPGAGWTGRSPPPVTPHPQGDPQEWGGCVPPPPGVWGSL